MIERVGYRGGTITVEYKLAPTMIVFSHGFGVLRDDRGLLSDLATSLPAAFGYILFDYYDTDETAKSIQIKSYADQIARLEAVLAWVLERQVGVQVHMIGHSVGCVVIASCDTLPNTGTITMLAPPLAFGRHFRQRFTDQPKVKTVNGIWQVPRSDGTVTLIPESYFKGLEQIDGEARLQSLSHRRPFTLVLPSQDEVLAETDYSELITNPDVSAVMIDDADHNFNSKTARLQLKQLIVEQLKTA